jgi:hypothetical protein
MHLSVEPCGLAASFGVRGNSGVAMDLDRAAWVFVRR